MTTINVLYEKAKLWKHPVISSRENCKSSLILKKKTTSKDGHSYCLHIEKMLLLIKSYYSFDAGGLAGVVFEGIEC